MADSEAREPARVRQRVSPRARSIALWAAALLTIVIGFVDLWRGGTTFAPILLVVGYCVLVPIAILK